MINIKAGDFLLNTHKSYVAFECRFTNCYSPDFSSLIEPIHMKLGPLEVPYSNGHYYGTQWKHTLAKEQLNNQKYGIGFMTEGSFQTKIDGSTIAIAGDNALSNDPDGYNALAAQLYGHFR